MTHTPDHDRHHRRRLGAVPAPPELLTAMSLLAFLGLRYPTGMPAIRLEAICQKARGCLAMSSVEFSGQDLNTQREKGQR